MSVWSFHLPGSYLVKDGCSIKTVDEHQLTFKTSDTMFASANSIVKTGSCLRELIAKHELLAKVVRTGPGFPPFWTPRYGTSGALSDPHCGTGLQWRDFEPPVIQ